MHDIIPDPENTSPIPQHSALTPDHAPPRTDTANVRDEHARPVANEAPVESEPPAPATSNEPTGGARPVANTDGAPPRTFATTSNDGETNAQTPDAPSLPAEEGNADDGDGEEERLDNPPSDVELLTVEEAVALLTERGLPRGIRTVQKYCHRRALKCYRTPTENGVRYMIDRTSINRMIEASAQQAPTGIGAAEPGQEPGIREKPAERHQEASQQPTPHFVPDGRLEMILERENLFLREQVAVKDQQLEAANARLSEANVLNQNLQDTVVKLTGNDRPRILNPAQSAEQSHDSA